MCLIQINCLYVHLNLSNSYLWSLFDLKIYTDMYTTSYFSSGTALSWFWCARIQGRVQFFQCRRLPYASKYELVCVFKLFPETTGPTEAKFHAEPKWDRGGKFIQMIPVICCSSFEYWPLGAGAFCRVFTTNVAPQCRAFRRALEIEKLKAQLFRDPEGAGDTNDWCIIGSSSQSFPMLIFVLIVLKDEVILYCFNFTKHALHQSCSSENYGNNLIFHIFVSSCSLRAV